MNSSESAEAVVKMTLEGVDVAVRITGRIAERVAMYLLAKSKETKTTKGKTSLNNMLKSGSPLKIFTLKREELEQFHKETKKYGVLYTALIDKKQTDLDGMVDIMVRAEDAPKINRIVERFKLSAVDIASIKTEIENDKIKEMIKDAKERGIDVKSDEEKLVEDVMSKPIDKDDSKIEASLLSEKEDSKVQDISDEEKLVEDVMSKSQEEIENDVENPQLGETEKSPLSEPSLKNKKDLGVASDNKKPSVRELLNRIKNELRNMTAPEYIKDYLKKGEDFIFVDADKKKITTYYASKNKKNKNKAKER